VVGDRASEDAMVGRAVVFSPDTMEGEDKPPEVSAETTVACANLSLEWTSNGSFNTFKGARQFLSHGTAIVLHKDPSDKSEGIRVEDSACGDADCVQLQEASHRGAWSELVVANQGVVVRGWARTKLVKLVPQNVGLGYSYFCDGHHGGGMIAFGNRGAVKVQAARIDPGTLIYTAPKGEAWATVLHPIKVEVEYVPGAAFGEVRHLPGIELGAERAWVPMKSARLLN
jgi:hypothetical protein